MNGLATWLITVDDPDLRPELDPYDVSPGLVGFLVMFVIALACILLFLSLTKHLRRSKHNEEMQQREAQKKESGADVDGDDENAAATTANEAPGADGSASSAGDSDGDDD